MRISDWSSDVCSSDLIVIIAFVTREQLAEHVDECVHYFVTLGVAGMVLVALRPHLFVVSSLRLIILASHVVLDGWPTTASQPMAVLIGRQNVVVGKDEEVGIDLCGGGSREKKNIE